MDIDRQVAKKQMGGHGVVTTDELNSVVQCLGLKTQEDRVPVRKQPDNCTPTSSILLLPALSLPQAQRPALGTHLEDDQNPRKRPNFAATTS